MKKLFLLLLLASCQLSDKQPAPDNTSIKKIIRDHYTADNKKDGAEFCSVEELKILHKKMTEGKCEVSYHIYCTFTGPAMADEYRRERPAINTDSIAILIKMNDTWQIQQ